MRFCRPNSSTCAGVPCRRRPVRAGSMRACSMRAGATLAELSIALVLLAVALATITQTMAVLAHHQRLHRQSVLAAVEAASVGDRVLAISWDELRGEDWKQGVRLSDEFQTQCPDAMLRIAAVDEPGPPAAKRIHVTIVRRSRDAANEEQFDSAPLASLVTWKWAGESGGAP